MLNKCLYVVPNQSRCEGFGYFLRKNDHGIVLFETRQVFRAIAPIVAWLQGYSGNVVDLVNPGHAEVRGDPVQPALGA